MSILKRFFKKPPAKPHTSPLKVSIDSLGALRICNSNGQLVAIIREAEDPMGPRVTIWADRMLTIITLKAFAG